MRMGVDEETTFLGGMVVLSTVSSDGDELEVEQLNRRVNFLVHFQSLGTL